VRRRAAGPAIWGSADEDGRAAAGRREPLEFVEKLLTGSVVALRDGAGQHIGLVDAFQVVGDVLGVVLGAQVPLEGVDQAGPVVGRHGRTVAQPRGGRGMG
jgi:hypothetical protein